jgi:hypothetical protein
MNTDSTKFIKLPNGNTLEVSIFPGFLEKVKEHFSLSNVEEVNDDHVRMYIYGAFKSALDKQ